MNVHVFGGASSSSCSNYALRKTAADNENKHRSEVAETLRNNFYVDGMLKSVSNEETAIKLIEGCKKDMYRWRFPSYKICEQQQASVSIYS